MEAGEELEEVLETMSLEEMLRDYHCLEVPSMPGAADFPAALREKGPSGHGCHFKSLESGGKGAFKGFLGREILSENNASELYFEEERLEEFIEKLEKVWPEVRYVNRLMTHTWGQKVVRFYDPDGNLIEVGTPMGKQDQRYKCGIKAARGDPKFSRR